MSKKDEKVMEAKKQEEKEVKKEPKIEAKVDLEAKSDKAKVERIDIFRAWCKRCGICVAFCPTSVFELDPLGNPIPTYIDICIGCKWCEIRCPDFAITVIEKKEIKDEGKVASRE